MIECHEERVDDDAQRDEELDERVVDEKADELLELDPVRRAVPHAANVQPLERKGQEPLLDLGAFVLFVGRRVCVSATIYNTRHHRKKKKNNNLRGCWRCWCSACWCRTAIRSDPMSCMAIASRSSSADDNRET